MNDILYLEIDEEIPSVIEKLKHQPTDDVVLVVPAGASIVQSVVNVKLLKRTADKLKKRLALVTTDPIGRHVASQVGLPVYVNVKDRRSVESHRGTKPDSADADELDLRPVVSGAPSGVSVHHYTEPIVLTSPSTPKASGFAAHVVPAAVSQPIAQPARSQPQSSSTSRRRLVGVFFGALSLVAGLIGLWYWYPAVTVDLTVATEPYKTTVPVTVDTSKQFVSGESTTTLPGEHVTITNDVSKEVPATGTKDVGTKAQGTVSFQNRLGQAVKLSRGTSLVVEGQSFVTTSEVIIPAATASIDGSGNIAVTPGSIDGVAEAGSAGESGNIAKGVLFVVQGAGSTVQEKVSATSKSAFAGGTSKQVTVVSDDDRSNARQQALDEAEQAAKREGEGSLQGKRLLDEAARTSVVSEELTPNEGDEASSVTAKISIKYEAIVFDDAAFRDAIGRQLQGAVPSDKMVVLGSNDDVTTTVASVDWSAGTLSLESVVQTRLSPRVKEAEVVDLLRGRKLSEAEAVLKRQSAIQQLSLTVRPSWLMTLPTRSSAFRVRFSQAEVR